MKLLPKRILTIALAGLMLLSLLPVTALAEEEGSIEPVQEESGEEDEDAASDAATEPDGEAVSGEDAVPGEDAEPDGDAGSGDDAAQKLGVDFQYLDE